MLLWRYPSFTSKALLHIQLILFLQYCTPEKYLYELDIFSAMVLFTLMLKSKINQFTAVDMVANHYKGHQHTTTTS